MGRRIIPGENGILIPIIKIHGSGDGFVKVSRSIDTNIEILKSRLPIGKSFDLIGRELLIADKRSYLLFIDGFAKDDVMIHVLKALQGTENCDHSEQNAAETNFTTYLIEKIIPYIELERSNDFARLEQFVLSGAILLFIDQQEDALVIDAREYPVRSLEEADTEKVTNGSKDGFVETIVFNTALIRRRVRDRNLNFEMKTVGTSSKTDVCLAYIKGNADEQFLKSLSDKIDHLEVEALVMAEKSLEELLVKKRWFNPLPQMRYTQRPDIAASYLHEGHVLILVDTSPSVMVTPSTAFYYTQFAEEFVQVPIVGTYYRLARFLALLTALLLTPTWLLLAENQQLLPEFLGFIGVKEVGTFPLPVQFLLLECGFDLLKMSSMHTPTYMGGAFGIIGGLLLGDFAIKVGVFIPETIFYMALVIMASYCIPNSDFTGAIRIFRMFLLILTGLLGGWGYAGALTVILLLFLTTATLDPKRPYLWPLIPFNAEVLGRFLFRRKVTNKRS